MRKKHFWWLAGLVFMGMVLFIAGYSYQNAENEPQRTEPTLSDSPKINMDQLQAQLSLDITGFDDHPSVVNTLAYDSKRVYGLYGVKADQGTKCVIFRASYAEDGAIEKSEFITADEDYQAFAPVIATFLDENLADLVKDQEEMLSSPDFAESI